MSRIDVVIISYNYGRFLRQCVDSVLTQTHEDCRVLIIDNGSTDATPALCAELAAQDGRVEVLRHPVNIGHIPAFNEAIQQAQGEYLLLVPADDFLLPGAIERAVALLDRRPEVGLVHGAWLHYRTGDVLVNAPKSDGSAVVLDSAEFIWELVLENRIAMATVIVRTAVQKALGGYLAALPHAGDLEMWLRFVLHSRVARLGALQAAFRRHDSNMSLSYSGLDDFEQRKAAIAMHLEEIRDRLPDGASLERRIRLHLLSRALFWLAFATRDRKVDRLSGLLAFALSNGLHYLASMLRMPSHVARER